jgi:hypothetical protein
MYENNDVSHKEALIEAYFVLAHETKLSLRLMVADLNT